MKYTHMLPFLEDEDIDELVEKILSGEVKGVNLMVLYPFLSRESLNKLVDRLIKDKKGKELRGAIPFISKEKVNAIYDAIVSGELTGIKESSLMPFLGKSKIKEMFNKLVEEAKDFDDEVEDEEDEE